MVRFMPNLKALALNKGAKDGAAVTQTEIARASGVSLATIQRWYNSSEGFDRIDAETVYPLMDYFGCSFEELVKRADGE